MEVFFLSYVNEQCITLDSVSFKLVGSKTQNQPNKSIRFIHTIVLLIYVNETMYLLGNLPFFKIHVNCFMAGDDSPCTILSLNIFCGGGA